MTQQEVKAWMLLAGFKDRGANTYSLVSKELWVMFNTYDITIQKRGTFPNHRWTTFRTSPEAALKFIKEQLT